MLREAGQDVPQDLLKFGTTVKRKEHSMYGHVHMNSNGGSGNGMPKKILFD